MNYFHLRPYAPYVSHKIDMLSQTKYFSFFEEEEKKGLNIRFRNSC